jgi:hypothetical protein
MSYNIFYVLAGLFALYLIINIYNKKNARRRKSRRFMEGYERKDRRADRKRSEDDPVS